MANRLELHPRLPRANLVDRILRLLRAHERGSPPRRQSRPPWNYLVLRMRMRIRISRPEHYRLGHEPGRQRHNQLRIRPAHGPNLLRRTWKKGRARIHGRANRNPIPNWPEPGMPALPYFTPNIYNLPNSQY